MRPGLLALLALVSCSSPTPPADERARPVPAPEERSRDATTAAATAPQAVDAGAQVPAPPQPVVSFGGAGRFGADSFVILPDGSARSSFTAPGRPAEVKSGRVAPTDLRALRDALRVAGCCTLASQRTTGVPDEAHTTLQLGFPGLACSVSLWDNEWHDLPTAAGCVKQLDTIRRRLR